MEHEESSKAAVGLGVTIPSPATLPSISPLVNSAILSPNASASAAVPQSLSTPSITPNTAVPPSAGGFSKAAEDASRAALQPLNVTPSNFSISPSVTSGHPSFDPNLRGFVPTPDYTPNTLLDRAQALAIPLEPYKIKSPSEIEKLTETELREALSKSQDHIRSLEQDLMKIRTASSHSALQHAMLVVGFENERDRFEVEKTMAKREVEVLKRNQESGGGVYQQTKLNELRVDIDVLRNRLKRAKQVIITEREKVGTLTKENERLKKRIKDNRAHNNMAERAMITAEAEAGRRRQLGQSAHRSTRSNVEDGLAALGQVASQALAEQRDEEARVTAANSPMHTPARHTPALERFGSSMHTPPQHSSQQSQQHPHLMSPVALSPARYTNWTTTTTTTLTPGKKHQRARDDTISASEGENASGAPRNSKKARTSHPAGTAAPPAKRQRTGTTPKTPKPRAKAAKQPASASGPKTGALDSSAKKKKQGTSTAPTTPAPEPREPLHYSPRPDIRRTGFQ